ncbi:unnamed protein product [marine sediment metagenome]|uniref:Uncharacterized protein n=1 Tax=marine sediment metagenome TaxID=412755 RepID=X1S9Y4_9ZZZZ
MVWQAQTYAIGVGQLSAPVIRFLLLAIPIQVNQNDHHPIN